MGTPVDVKLNYNKKYWDISFDDVGDFVLEDGFDTAILISLMSDKRASSFEESSAQYRRGWWGNETSDLDNFEIGSKLWLLSQARATQTTLNKAKNFSEDALQWLVTYNYIDSIDVEANYNNNVSLTILMTFIRSGDIILSRGFDVWNNTFTNEG